MVIHLSFHTKLVHYFIILQEKTLLLLLASMPPLLETEMISWKITRKDYLDNDIIAIAE